MDGLFQVLKHCIPRSCRLLGVLREQPAATGARTPACSPRGDYSPLSRELPDADDATDYTVAATATAAARAGGVGTDDDTAIRARTAEVRLTSSALAASAAAAAAAAPNNASESVITVGTIRGEDMSASVRRASIGLMDDRKQSGVLPEAMVLSRKKSSKSDGDGACLRADVEAAARAGVRTVLVVDDSTTSSKLAMRKLGALG